MSYLNRVAEESKNLFKKPFCSTFRSTSGTASLYAPILAIPKYNYTNSIPQSNSTIKVIGVARERYDETTVSILTLDDGVTNKFLYKKPRDFDLVVNDDGTNLVLYGRCSYGGTTLMAFIDYSNQAGYIIPYNYAQYSVDIATLTNQITPSLYPYVRSITSFASGWSATVDSQNKIIKSYDGIVTVCLDVTHSGETNATINLTTLPSDVAPLIHNNVAIPTYARTNTPANVILNSMLYNQTGIITVYGTTGATRLTMNFTYMI